MEDYWRFLIETGWEFPIYLKARLEPWGGRISIGFAAWTYCGIIAASGWSLWNYKLGKHIMRGVLVVFCLIIAVMVFISAKNDSSISNEGSTLDRQMKSMRDKFSWVQNDNRKLLKMEDFFAGRDFTEIQDVVFTHICDKNPIYLAAEHYDLKIFIGFEAISVNFGSEVNGSAFGGQIQSPTECKSELVSYDKCSGNDSNVLSHEVSNRGKEPMKRLFYLQQQCKPSVSEDLWNMKIGGRKRQQSNWETVVAGDEQGTKNTEKPQGIQIKDLDNEEEMQQSTKKMKTMEANKKEDGQEGDTEKKEDGHAGHNENA